MGYLLHPDFQTPPEDTIIWKYMDLPKFLLMLEQGGLYFSLLTEFTDKWEGVISRMLTQAVASAFGGASGGVIEVFQAFIRITAVNCWYQGAGESVAMWELYTKTEYGVAIKSTVGDLMRAVSVYQPSVHIASMKYEDHTDSPAQTLTQRDISAYKAVLQKRTCYQHERELRVITQLVPPLPKNPPPNTFVISPFPERGSVIPLSLSALINSVTIGPHYPEWGRGLLDAALQRAKIKVPIVESSAFKPPPGSFIVG